MGQAILPLIPEGATSITDILSVVRANGTCYYFCGNNPVFAHGEDDVRSLQMFTSQLVCQGQCKQVDIVRAFRVSANTVKRAVKKYREGGVQAFYAPRNVRGARVLTDEVKERAQALLDDGCNRKQVAQQLGIKPETLRKAISQGRLRKPEPTRSEEVQASTKSQRSGEDACATMGTACTRPLNRALAAAGALQGAPTEFEASYDVSYGGVLCALPALQANGLFRHWEKCFGFTPGYYTLPHIMTLLGYMALCRVKTVEQLAHEAPGEFGKLLGLDRVPEVRCLRQKLKLLSEGDGPQRWSTLLSEDWMEEWPERAGTLYVDGHVRVYHGHLARLPRRYVSRQRLCLRGTTDYWVNDALGQPFFVVDRTVDEGLIRTLQTDIVPRLLEGVPNQPSAEDLEANPYLHRFIMVFDRQGYSPQFFREMWQKHRIACITYHKYPDDPWPEEWFSSHQVVMPKGECVEMKLAEMGTHIGGQKTGIWVREVRKLTASGHQTSLVSTAYCHFSTQDGAYMFSRWSQENFFGYMMKHFVIDLLSEYGTEEIPGPQRVVNPERRKLDGEHRSAKGKLNRRIQEFGVLSLDHDMESTQYEEWESRKAELRDTIDQLENELDQLAEKRKETPKHLSFEDLPKEEKFQRLAPNRKHLLDTVKMIAYRAETAMAAIVREHMGKPEEARTLLRELYRSEADLLPDKDNRILYVHVHQMATPRANAAIAKLLDVLNESELVYPGTDMKVLYRLGQSP